MKSNDAKPGQMLQYIETSGKRRTAFFVKRFPRYGTTPAFNLLRVPDFAGQDGPEDEGLCKLSDKEMKRCCKAYR